MRPMHAGMISRSLVSQQMPASARYPRWTHASVPRPVRSSSTKDSTITTQRGRRPRPRRIATAITRAATPPFMSEAPRPHTLPSATAPDNAPRAHSWSGSRGTVSTWPLSRIERPPPRPLHTPTTFGRPARGRSGSRNPGYWRRTAGSASNASTSRASPRRVSAVNPWISASFPVTLSNWTSRRRNATTSSCRASTAARMRLRTSGSMCVVLRVLRAPRVRDGFPRVPAAPASVDDHEALGGEPADVVGPRRVLPVRHREGGRLPDELGGEVAQPVVVDHRDDRPQLGVPSAELQARHDVAPRGDPAEDPLFPCEPARHRDRIVRGHRDHPVDPPEIQHIRDEAIPDSFDPVRPPPAPREDRALGRFHREAEDLRSLRFEVRAHACKRPAGALRGDERVDASVCLLPDLRAGRLRVRPRVVGVGELSDLPDAVAILRFELLHPLQNEIHIALSAGREHQLRAVGPDHLLPLAAHALGHDDD